ncbi:hypothetical protein VNI00_014982 [Paramarasmius palmivorus]|uniref:Gelsolin-like domain-containing protein n=1 Tax=Paramarasmius palmivorus TaxID=297713 RepID=A0AAW0BNC6_9AGAR
MAYLTKPNRYDIKDSNIALLGSDLEKNVRQHAGDTEPAWSSAGLVPGLQIWRIEDFHVIPWPEERKGEFFDGDSYIVLNTYKKDPESEKLSYDLHFWLGENTTQDEAGTAAYKTVELDDHLHGLPTQYREIQNHESTRFLSYFSSFRSLHGGVDSGFHHVEDPPSLELFRLYRVSSTKSSGVVLREVPPVAESIVQGDVYILDKGSQLLQLNTKESVGKEKFGAADFVRKLAEKRRDEGKLTGECEIVVYDEGTSGFGLFLAEFKDSDTDEIPTIQPRQSQGLSPHRLIRISDASGELTFEEQTLPHDLASEDTYILDACSASFIRLAWEWFDTTGKEVGGPVCSAVSLPRRREGCRNAHC